MSNISWIISGHNKNLLSSTVTQYGCNCLIREDAWNCRIGGSTLQNQCLAPNIVYRADVHCKANKDYKFYFGIVELLLKKDSDDNTMISNTLEAQSYPIISGC